MTAANHFRDARNKALELRKKYGFSISVRVEPEQVEDMCFGEGVDDVDYYEGLSSTHIRGAYFKDEKSSVVVSAQLKKNLELRAKTLAHELKHHVMKDSRLSYCKGDESQIIERGANIFATELLFPRYIFEALVIGAGIKRGQMTPEDIVTLKHQTKTTLSHQGLARIAVQLGYADRATMRKVYWRRLRNRMYPQYVIKSRILFDHSLYSAINY